MKKNNIVFAAMVCATAAIALTGCQPDNVTPSLPDELVEETYAGGRLGTTFN